MRRELDRAILEVVDIPQGCLITIEDVQTSRDLHHAKVFVSVYPPERRDEMVRLLNNTRTDLHREIADRLIMKFLPKLTFLPDEREEKADRINRLLDQSE